MKCKIKSKTTDSNGESLFEGDGEYYKNAGERVVEYTYGGDPCKLIFCGDSLTQLHGGDMNLSITFTQGKATECAFLEGSLSGGYKIFTNKLSVSERAGALFARVLYHVADDSSLYTDIKVCVVPQRF